MRENAEDFRSQASTRLTSSKNACQSNADMARMLVTRFRTVRLAADWLACSS